MQDHQEIQKKLFYYSALVESNPEYVCIEGGNKFKAKAMVLKLQRQLSSEGKFFYGRSLPEKKNNNKDLKYQQKSKI